jgi:hypothetical protein
VTASASAATPDVLGNLITRLSAQSALSSSKDRQRISRQDQA